MCPALRIFTEMKENTLVETRIWYKKNTDKMTRKKEDNVAVIVMLQR